MTSVPAPEKTTTTAEEELSYPILLADRVIKSANEAVSFKSDCSDLSSAVHRLSSLLRSAVRLTTTAANSAAVYDPPIRRISADVSRNLHRALSLLRLCRRRSFLLHRLFRILSSSDFRKLLSLLDSSSADLRWLLSVLDHGAAAVSGGGGCAILSLPPIASNDPIIAWVWSFTAAVQMSPELADRTDAASELAELARDNDRNKKMIVEESAVLPLLKLLKDGAAVPEARIAAATAIYEVANDGERVRVVVEHHGVPLIVQVLAESPMRVQIRVSELVARMAEYDVVAKEEFARENVIRPLVSVLLSFECEEGGDVLMRRNLDFHSVVQINKEKEREKRELLSSSVGLVSKPSKPRLSSSFSSFKSDMSGSKGGGGRENRKERENESPEVKRELQISSARALWMLAKDSISNSRRITETKGLLCLAKLIEKEHGELQKNCLMTVMEITSAAESNSDLRRSAFKTNSPAAKAVVDQLVNLIKESRDPGLQIPALKSIGSLSRTFPARETRVVAPLVEQLSNPDHEVATEAAIALGKFVSPENFLCQEHSKAIIEFNGVLPLMRLLRASERAQVHGLALLCYLAINASNNEALEQARVLTALEGTDKTVSFVQQPQLRELIDKAIYHLNLYRNDAHRHPVRQGSLRI